MVQTRTIEQSKAQVLVDALSYIQKFNGNIVVIKYGGSAMTNEVIKHSVLKDIAVLKSVGIKPVIVHGGGNDINKWLTKVGIKSNFKNVVFPFPFLPEFPDNEAPALPLGSFPPGRRRPWPY